MADGYDGSRSWEIVYLLTNPAMPGMVKIGRTTQTDARTRLDQLYTTGVPVPFELVFACRVANSAAVETALHTAFRPQRVNPRREFFQIEPDQALAILRLLHVEDATPAVEAQPTSLQPADVAAGEELRRRRPNFDFVTMGVPLGAILQCTRAEAQVTVTGRKAVTLEGEEMSLTAATRQIMGYDYNVQPGPYWTWEGTTIRDLYVRTYD